MGKNIDLRDILWISVLFQRPRGAIPHQLTLDVWAQIEGLGSFSVWMEINDVPLIGCDFRSLPSHGCTVDSAFSGLCVKRTSVLSGQIFWSRQDVPLF